jgi:putative SOS response-associated peptidase YedK
MCYSSLVWQALSDYFKVFGAIPDYDQIEEIYLQRLTDKAPRITRGFERNFDQPRRIEEKRIKDLIDQYRSATTTKLEQELFVQKKRLADARRKLQLKETKTAMNEQRIASSKIQAILERLSLLRGTQLHADDNRIFPMTYSPLIVKQGDKNVVKLARYHLRQAGKPPSFDRQFPGLYNARRDNLQQFWQKEFGHAHGLLVMDSFFENVTGPDGKNLVLHFTPRPPQTMLVACLYAESKQPDGTTLLSFAAITDEPPAEVRAAGHDRCVIPIQPENVERWLTPQGRSTDELQAILSERQQPYYEHQVEAA